MDETKNFVKFELDDKKYTVIKPTNKIRKQSDAIYAKAYREAIGNGFLLNVEIDKILEERNLTDNDITKERTKLVKQIRDLEVILAKEEYSSVEEGKEVAFKIKDLRSQLINADTAKSELNKLSADNLAENKRFAFLSYSCISSDDGKPVWSSFEEYEDDESPLAYKAASELLVLQYNIYQDNQKEVESHYTENVWLIKNGFMNDNLDLIDDKGRMIDRHGRLINDKGEFINEDGHRIDIYGNLLDDKGRIIFIKQDKKEEA